MIEDWVRVDRLDPFEGERGRAQSRSRRCSPGRLCSAIRTEASSEKPPMSHASLWRTSSAASRPSPANPRSARRRAGSPCVGGATPSSSHARCRLRTTAANGLTAFRMRSHML